MSFIDEGIWRERLLVHFSLLQRLITQLSGARNGFPRADGMMNSRVERLCNFRRKFHVFNGDWLVEVMMMPAFTSSNWFFPSLSPTKNLFRFCSLVSSVSEILFLVSKAFSRRNWFQKVFSSPFFAFHPLLIRYPMSCLIPTRYITSLSLITNFVPFLSFPVLIYALCLPFTTHRRSPGEKSFPFITDRGRVGRRNLFFLFFHFIRALRRPKNIRNASFSLSFIQMPAKCVPARCFVDCWTKLFLSN